MARGNSAQSDYKTFFVKLKSKDLDEPVFEFKQALGKDKLGEIENYNNLEGSLVMIEKTENEHNGKVILGFRMHFVDTVVKERYIFSGSFSWLTRGIIDSLLNLTEFDNLSISVYAKAGKGDYANKVFHNAFVRRGDEPAGWKHGNKVFNPMVTDKPLGKGETKPEKDYYDLDKFLQGEIEKHLQERVSEFAKAIGLTKVDQPEEDCITGDLPPSDTKKTATPPPPPETDDLPF